MYKIKIYHRDSNGFHRDVGQPIEIESKSLHGAKVKTHAKMRTLGLKPHTRQWIPRMTFIRKPLAGRHYQNQTGDLRLVVIGKE